MSTYDPLPILDVLNANGVEYVVIGGYAASLHASPFITYDVDITPRRSQENLERLSRALASIGARIRTKEEPDGLPFSHTGASLGAANVWSLITEHGEVDVCFVPNGTDGYADLAKDAETMTIHGIGIRVASLADIIRSKQAANRPKDQRVLPTLREILASRHEKNR